MILFILNIILKSIIISKKLNLFLKLNLIINNDFIY